MSRLAARIRIVRMLGGRYKVEKIKVSDDQGDRVDLFNVPIVEDAAFPTKQEARERGAELAHAFITSKYSEGARYQIQWKTRVEIRQDVAGKTPKQ
jgi:hypothetical protein